MGELVDNSASRPTDVIAAASGADSHRRNWVADRYRLAAALDAANPRRARGGWHGFAGFTFQIYAALLNYVRTLPADDFDDAPHLDFEALADFAIEESGLIYTYEAKRSLTRTTLPQALAVLRDVYTTALETDPDIADRLRFRVTCAQLTITEPLKRAEIWADADGTEAASVVAARLVVDTERDPQGELYALLAHRFRVSNPPAVVDRWMRHISEQAMGGSGLTSTIVDSLREIDERDLPFVVLSSEDREPSETRSHVDGYLAGEQPTLIHLRQGFFAPHEDIGLIESHVLSWHERVIDDPLSTAKGSVPVYWVGGPSGSGKSILTLQLLAVLNSRPGSTVIWLGSSIENLTDAMRFAKRISRERTVYIGLDDPFAGGPSGIAFWKAALGELTQMRHDGDLSQLPVVLCCGTGEQLETFRQSGASDVALEVWTTEPPSSERRRHLRQWFFDRTGNEAYEYEDNQSILPAQLFFEWSKREGIKSFANRFRGRVRSLSSETSEFIETVLALNRLYVGVPDELMVTLSPAASDELRQLEGDQHFGFRSSGRAGYWLSHPHLSDILYDTWFPRERFANTRAAHLSGVLVKLINADTGGLASSRVLSALTATTRAAYTTQAGGVGRLDAAELQSVGAAGARAVVDIDGMAAAALGAWVRFEAVVPESFDTWSPRSAALAKLQRDDTDRHAILAVVNALLSTGDAAVLNAVHRFADRDPLWDSWADVMLALVDQGVDVNDSIVVGIERCPTDQLRIDVLERALHNYNRAEPLQILARRLLLGDISCGSDISLGRIARVMMGGSEEDRDAAVEWVAQEVRLENGPLLLESQSRRNAPIALLKPTQEWLLHYPEHAAAQELFLRTLSWQKLCDPDFRAALTRHLARHDLDDNSRLVTKVTALLTSNRSRSPWSFAYQDLLRALPSSQRMQQIGADWLDENSGSPAWHGVWMALAQNESNVNQSLAARGAQQLAAVRDPETWPLMMHNILRLAEDSERGSFVDEAVDWLRCHPASVTGWGYLFPGILSLDVDRNRADLDDLAQAWLREHTDKRPWRFVWSAALAHADDRRRVELRALALEWLSVDREDWAGVLRLLWPMYPEVDRPVDIAINWLVRSAAHPYWSWVFGTVASSLRRDQMVDVLNAWFRTAAGSNNQLIGYVWKILVDDGLFPDLPLDARLRQSFTHWLKGSGSVRSWWYIWTWLMRTAPLESWPIEVALAARLSTKRAHGVANRLAKQSRSDPARATLIEAVLRQAPVTPTAAYTFLEIAGGSNGHRVIDLGPQFLVDEDADYFPAVWKFLWDAADQESRAELEDVGLSWCASHGESLSWGGIWTRLFDANTARHDEIMKLGESWLSSSNSRDSKRRNEVDAKMHGRRSA